MTSQDTADKTTEETEAPVHKHYGYDNWYWLMDQPLEQNLNPADSSNYRS